MATKNFRSTVLEPTSEFAHGDKLRFTALATVGEVLKGSFSETTIGEDGVYSVDLQYGKHRIDYKPYEGCWRHFADVEVNADTLATTLQDLALASVPVTDETILVLQGILADAEAAKTESAAIRDEAAASAAAAVNAADSLETVIPASSFLKNYNVGFVDSDTAGSGKYNLIKIDSFASTVDQTIINFNASGSNAAYCFSIIPLLSSSNYHSGVSAVVSRQEGSGYSDARFFWDQLSSKESYLYLALRNTFTNSSAMSVLISTCKKISPVSLGAVSIDAWLADNPTAVEVNELPSTATSAIEDDVISSLRTVDGTEYRNVPRSGAKNYGMTDEQFNDLFIQQQSAALFESEKGIALQIMADFNLGTGEHEITGSDIADVRAYVQSIDPAKGLKAGHLQRAKIPRPSIFDRYS